MSSLLIQPIGAAQMKKDLILSKQLAILEKQEQKFLNHTDSEFIKSNFTPMVNKIQAKIPEKLQSTLDATYDLNNYALEE
jgi:hypothetical protein